MKETYKYLNEPIKLLNNHNIIGKINKTNKSDSIDNSKTFKV